MLTGNKTQENDESVDEFLESVNDETKKKDSFVLRDFLMDITGEAPKMWGDSIVGFGKYHYKYKSGREGDWFKVGFSPRKQSLTVYLKGYMEGLEDLLDKLGKYKVGKSCIYIKKITDVDLDVLKTMIKRSIAQE